MHPDFWAVHGIFFLIFIASFPRLTLLLGSVASGGLLWWLGWLFCPRLLVAGLATLAYWESNPVLVIGAWVVALGGESSEKVAFVKRPRIMTFRTGTVGNSGAFRAARKPPKSGDQFENAKWVDAEKAP